MDSPVPLIFRWNEVTVAVGVGKVVESQRKVTHGCSGVIMTGFVISLVSLKSAFDTEFLEDM